jgi:ribonuclease P protein component
MQLRSRHGFARAMRLTRERDFQRVLRTGSRARSTHLLVAVAPNGLELTRLGISIGKRIEKSAVRRNRMRRLVREAFRLSYAELPRGVDLLVMAAEPKIELDLVSTRAELVLLARKAERRWREKARASESTEESRRRGEAR